MKNENVIYLTDLIKRHKLMVAEINFRLESMIVEAELSCKFYDYDDGAHEMVCRAEYEGMGRENCLDCDEFELKEKVK